MEKLFDTLYNASEETLANERKASTKKRVKRGFDSAINNLEDEILDNEEKLEKLRRKVANGDVTAIRELAETSVTIMALKDVLAVVNEEKDRFF